MPADRKIVDELIACKQNYDKLYIEFPFKNNLEASFKHEYDNYLTPVFTKVVPRIYEHLKVNEDAEIEDYYPYIVFKYHDIVKKEVIDFEKNNAAIIRGIAKKVHEEFTQQLMLLAKENQSTKHEFLEQFFKKHAKEILLVFKTQPILGIETLAKMRNPVMQNTIMTYLEGPIKEYISSKSWESFEEELLPFFVYPLEVTVNDYYDKWISKEAIHVKFANKILGEHYEKTKKALKEKEKAENYKRKQEHYDKLQRKHKKLEEKKKLEEDNK